MNLILDIFAVNLAIMKLVLLTAVLYRQQYIVSLSS